MFEVVETYEPYAGIGARETPQDILNLIIAISKMLDDRGYVLRSGGAEGADRAFDLGTSGTSHPEIYLPWHGFNGQHQREKPTAAQLGNAYKIAEAHHPAWHNCSEGARKMHVRNVFQILGLDLNIPSRFVVCWTKDGRASGGTGQALRIAQHYEIPIYNLRSPETRGLFYQELGWPS